MLAGNTPGRFAPPSGCLLQVWASLGGTRWSWFSMLLASFFIYELLINAIKVAFLQTLGIHFTKRYVCCLDPSFWNYFPHFRVGTPLAEHSWANVKGPVYQQSLCWCFQSLSCFPAALGNKTAGKKQTDVPQEGNWKFCSLYFHFSHKLLTASVRRRSRWPLTPLKEKCPYWKRCSSLTSSLGRDW